MPHLDHHVMMTLKLGPWAQDHTLSGFDIEREIAAARSASTEAPKQCRRRFSLGNLKMLWTASA